MDISTNIVFVVLDLVCSHASAAVQVAAKKFLRVDVFSVLLSVLNDLMECSGPRAQSFDLGLVLEAAATVEFGVAKVFHLVNLQKQSNHGGGGVLQITLSEFLTHGEAGVLTGTQKQHLIWVRNLCF